MTLEFTKPELDILTALMDAGVKAVGIQAIRPEVVSVVSKITEALKSSNEIGIS